MKNSVGTQVLLAMLWYGTFAKRQYPDQSVSHTTAVDYLVKGGYLTSEDTVPVTYTPTSKGSKWVTVLRRTPPPTCKKLWVDAQGEVVQ